MAAVNTVTSCRQIFKELRILTIASLYILEVIRYLRRHHQFVELNSNIHTYNTRRKMDIHIQSYKTDLYRVSRGNVKNFGRVFLMLKYTDITQNTYIRS
jgi:hypothetical protein